MAVTRFLLVLVVALCASLTVSPALAQAEGLGLYEAEGEPLEENAELQFLSEDLTFETSAEISVNCTETELQAVLTENGGELSRASLVGGRFEGTGGGGKCQTTSALTASVVGPTEPWIFEFRENGELVIVPEQEEAEEEKGVSFGVDFYLGETLIANCKYEAGSLVGEFELYEPLGLSITAQEVTGSGLGCPEAGSLSGNFAIMSGGKQVTPGDGRTVTLRASGKPLGLKDAVSASSTNLVFTQNDKSGRIECTKTNAFAGEVTLNGKAKASIKVTSMEFKGTEANERCETTIKPGGVAATGVITAENLPWEIHFNAGGIEDFAPTTPAPVKFKEDLYSKAKPTDLLLRCRYQENWIGHVTLGVAMGLVVRPSFLGGLPLDPATSDATCSKSVDINGTYTVLTSPGNIAVVSTSP